MRDFDVIVVGAGHAGCEAALAAARLGCSVLVLATNLDTVAFLACNPSIGGTAKGQIVKEIDALGGEMAVNADKSLLQMRMLNKGKGPAVYSPRAQVDKNLYHVNMKRTLESTPNLFLRQGEAVSLRQTECGYEVATAVGLVYRGKAVILCCGVYLNSRTIVGQCVRNSGPNGFANAQYLTESLISLGFTVRRFKTGTPARVRLQSLDLNKTTEQEGDDCAPFSAMTDVLPPVRRSCYLTYSTEETKRIILSNKHLAPLYNGSISGVGPRYCPSIEDKVVRFSDKERHQIFLEPESSDTCEFYVQGASSSMPAEVQEQIYRSIEGLEHVEIMRDAYAIEYDCIDATDLDATLMSKRLAGLFCAGQINGTSGYEEAAAQGIVAGINAERYVHGKAPVTFPRDNSYIGVLVDDITTKETFEPYRMMTSRAEHRLVLRQDNADLRLTEQGHDVGLVSEERYQRYLRRKSLLMQAQKQLSAVISPKVYAPLFEKKGEVNTNAGLTLDEILRRPNISAKDLRSLGYFADMPDDVLQETEIECKYRGYIQKEKESIAQARKLEDKPLPKDINYLAIEGLRLEARQKLDKIRPANLGQAGRISGVSPADVQILIVYLAQNRQN
ncbi:MAG TPA: tRNA uridine-5-carboxymethylaminomethyl(34) synthesis enzyme MnmG [Candidatus Fimimonas merdipullorum]|uniref:tRNA uridine 5-carboxymethylaminomethyl modification enzyme MnmG n=1 Tax=Candidatus Fimimonas merdipullorum TaxID=2840822 RepID=A0A9D1MWP7_9BACT|nr:tRNA uridine-5-carboxymethylaminomethyl(34) synthesis enzyme MnmG [Candidatus Fimimonas merdipullorum]